MKILAVFFSFFEYTGLLSKKEIFPNWVSITFSKKNVLVLFTTFETIDTKEICLQQIEQIIAETKSNPQHILIYPFAHLSATKTSKLNRSIILEFLKNSKNKFFFAPDGIEKTYTGTKITSEKFYDSRYFKEKANQNAIFLKISGETKISKLTESEVLNEQIISPKNKTKTILQKYGIDKELLAEKGQSYFFLFGSLLRELVKKMYLKLLTKISFKTYHLVGANMFNLESNPIRKHIQMFGSRGYFIESDRSIKSLRYAACFQQFALAKKFGVPTETVGFFEFADSYRMEQRGEIVPCFRERKFQMPDMHIFCKDLQTANQIFIELHQIINFHFKQQNVKLVKFCNIAMESSETNNLINQLIPKNETYFIKKYLSLNTYWNLNIEYLYLSRNGKYKEVPTLQMDLKNSKNFEILNNSGEYPIIIHSALLGSIERYIYLQTEIAINQGAFNFWFSPIQVVVLPISEKHLAFATKFALKLVNSGFRVLVYNLNQRLQKKLVLSRNLLFPVTIVVGQKEKDSKQFSTTILKITTLLTISQIISQLEILQKDYPKLGKLYSTSDYFIKKLLFK